MNSTLPVREKRGGGTAALRGPDRRDGLKEGGAARSGRLEPGDRERARQLLAIVDHSPAVIHLKDLDGRYILVNRRFEEILHVTRRAARGKTALDIFDKATAAALQNHDREVRTSRAPREFEETLLLTDGPHTFISIRFPLLDPAGNPYATCGISTDITERKRAEEALKTALRQIKKAHEDLQTTQMQLIHAAKLESVGTLAAGVAHEVKNPLQMIILGVDFLEGALKEKGDNIAEVLHNMRDAVLRANSIVRELLDFSAADEFELKPENLNEVIERSLWLVHNEIVTSRTEVVHSLARDLPAVNLDRRRMEQVFLNLFINALQAMEPGGRLSVTTRAERFGEGRALAGPAFAGFSPGESVVTAEVRDSGPGIPPKVLPKIFDPFFTTKPVGAGTGLGLPVAKRIVDLHHGAISIANAPEGGAIVTLILRTKKEKQV